MTTPVSRGHCPSPPQTAGCQNDEPGDTEMAVRTKRQVSSERWQNKATFRPRSIADTRRRCLTVLDASEGRKKQSRDAIESKGAMGSATTRDPLRRLHFGTVYKVTERKSVAGFLLHLERGRCGHGKGVSNYYVCFCAVRERVRPVF